MKGEVYKIWENETKDNKVFHVVEIAGERYSVWEPSLLEGVEEGSRVEYDWQKAGNFKKITDLTTTGCLALTARAVTPGRPTSC